MKIIFLKDDKVAISCREIKDFKKDEIVDLEDDLADSLIKGKKAILYSFDIKEENNNIIESEKKDINEIIIEDELSELSFKESKVKDKTTYKTKKINRN